MHTGRYVRHMRGCLTINVYEIRALISSKTILTCLKCPLALIHGYVGKNTAMLIFQNLRSWWKTRQIVGFWYNAQGRIVQRISAALSDHPNLPRSMGMFNPLNEMNEIPRTWSTSSLKETSISLGLGVILQSHPTKKTHPENERQWLYGELLYVLAIKDIEVHGHSCRGGVAKAKAIALPLTCGVGIHTDDIYQQRLFWPIWICPWYKSKGKPLVLYRWTRQHMTM